MKTVSTAVEIEYLARRTRILLSELQEACQQVPKLLARLETPGLTEKQVDDILGDLSALVVHLHAHTRGLDEVIVKDGTKQSR